MKVAFDTNMLLMLLDDDLSPPLAQDGDGNLVEVSSARERVDHLFNQLDRSKADILIPTPVLAEVLTNAGDATEDWRRRLEGLGRVRIEPFCYRSALELAVAHSGRSGGEEGSRTKVKIDRQIVAVAKVHGAETIYTSDRAVQNHARRNGMDAVGVADLAYPPTDPQADLALQPPDDDGDQDDRDRPDLPPSE